MPQFTDQKKISAEQRQATRNNRSDQDQLMHLDDMFGLNVGAKRERARLHKRIANATITKKEKK